MWDRLLLIGDSVAKGVTYEESSGRYSLCSRQFASLRARGVTVQNQAKMGAGVAHAESILSNPRFVPDETTLVLLSLGGNDSDFAWSEISAAPEKDHQPMVTLSAFAERLRACIRKAQNLGAAVAVTSFVPLDAERYLEQISLGLDRSRILKWLGSRDILYRWHEAYSREAERVARETGSALIDLRSNFLLRHDFKNLLCRDGIHPTPSGHALIEAQLDKEAAALWG